MTEQAQQRQPMRVIPIEQQVTSDSRWGNAVALALMSVALAGGLVMTIRTSSGSAMNWIMLLILIATMATMIATILRGARDSEITTIAPAIATGAPESPRASVQPPPLPLGYRTPIPDRRGVTLLGALGKFTAGVALGSLISGAIWFGAWDYIDHGNGGFLIIAVPGLKFVLGITGLCFRGWRMFAAGLLVSIPIGFLLFFGACAANFKI
jgi:hypothetical protein